MTMARLVTLLLMLVLVVANGPAVATAICQHQDAQAHAAAVQSADASVSREALNEEVAAKAVSLDGALSDAAGTLLAGYILPPEFALPVRSMERTKTGAAPPIELANRSVSPLLEPPLG